MANNNRANAPGNRARTRLKPEATESLSGMAIRALSVASAMSQTLSGDTMTGIAGTIWYSYQAVFFRSSGIMTTNDCAHLIADSAPVRSGIDTGSYCSRISERFLGAASTPLIE